MGEREEKKRDESFLTLAFRNWKEEEGRIILIIVVFVMIILIAFNSLSQVYNEKVERKKDNKKETGGGSNQ